MLSGRVPEEDSGSETVLAVLSDPGTNLLFGCSLSISVVEYVIWICDGTSGDAIEIAPVVISSLSAIQSLQRLVRFPTSSSSLLTQFRLRKANCVMSCSLRFTWVWHT